MYFQQLFILGRATKDAEISSSKEGKDYGRFTVAVNEYNRKTKEELPSFFNVLVFNKTLKGLEKVKKGDLVMIEGRPEAEAYLSKEGEAKAQLTVYSNKWKLIK